MGSRTYAEWLAYYQVEPFGELQADYRSGLLATMMANSGRDAHRRSKPYELADFYPWLEEEKPARSARDLYQDFKSWAMMAR